MSWPPKRSEDPLAVDPRQYIDELTPFEAGYERPNEDYRCGRERFWRKPCPRGPSVYGECRGTSECAPAFRNGRYECRRRSAAGGPCEDGPLPDGSCSHRHPPCVPRRTLRAIRGRLTTLAALVPIALIVAFLDFGGNDPVAVSSVDSGPLTGAHASFTREEGCVACHEPHGAGVATWLNAAFVPRGDGVSARCLGCHTFDGDPLRPHNMVAANPHPESEPTRCVRCHTEHKGVDADIKGLTDRQCNSCHEQKFESFTEGHPPFPERYPHTQRNSVWFDHAAHFGRHFEDPDVADMAPEVCSDCHQVESAALVVEPSSFEQSCAACHADDIPSREFVLWRWPEILENRIDTEEVVEICGPTPDQFEAMQERLAALESGDVPEEEEEDEFYGVSLDYMTSFAAFLLGVPSDDPDAHGDIVQELAMDMIDDGIEPLAERVDELAGSPVSEKLFARLTPEVIHNAFCAWAANTEYEIPSDPEFGGWYADGVSIRFRPVRHDGLVPHAWVEFALDVPNLARAAGADEDQMERAEDFRDSIIDPDGGIGACTKCHAVNQVVTAGTAEADGMAEGAAEAAGAADGDSTADAAEIAERLRVAWNFNRGDPRPYVGYSHKPHLNLLGEDIGCKNCHVLDFEVDYESMVETFDPGVFVSNFKPIQKETCVQCHTEGGVRQDCQLCHDYHLNPSFKLEIAGHGEEAS